MEDAVLGKNEIGQIGERLAVEYLARRGYKILENNYRTPFGEIDIVAEKNDEIVFVEVKTHLFEDGFSPLENITYGKTKNIIKNALFYLKRHGKADSFCRIDAVAVTLCGDGELKTLEHVEGAIELPVGVNYG